MTDLDLAETRLLAWHTLPCRYCGEPVGRRCITTSGTRTTPHQDRLDDIAIWLLRQPEVDALTAARDLLTNDLRAATLEVTGLTDQVRTLTRDLEATTAELAAAKSSAEGYRLQVLSQQDSTRRVAEERDAIRAEFEAYKASHPDPTPEPPSQPRTYVGACPAKSNAGFNLRAAQGVVDRFGKGAAVRLFDNGTTPAVAPRPADAGHVHASWALPISSRPTAADFVTAARDLKSGDGAERNHEADLKVRKGTYTLAQANAALTDFATKMKQDRPDLLTTITFTGWLFSPAPSAPGLAARNAWGPTASHFDVVGVDLDGIHGWPYPKYAGHIPNILAFLDKYDIEWFAVPEVGWSRDQTNDPTGTKRMDDLATLVAALEATGRCRWIDAYVYESTAGNDFNAAETAAWRNLVTTT